MSHIVKDLDVLLFALLGSRKLVDRWWNSPNLAFDSDTPEQVWRTDPDRVKEYLQQFSGGDYS